MPLLRKLKENENELADASLLYPHQKTLFVGEREHDERYTSPDGKFIVYGLDRSSIRGPDPKSSLIRPSIPQRSAQRTPARPKEVMLHQKEMTLETIKKHRGRPVMRSSDPHELYQSSEEDVSVTDCSEELLFDSDDSDIDPRSGSCNQEPQEIMAKAISFRMVGKAQIVEINSHSYNPSPRASLSIKDDITGRPTLPRLPTLTFTLGDFHIDDQELFPSSPRLTEQKPETNLGPSKPVEVRACRYSSDSEPPKPSPGTNNSLSIFRRGSLLGRRTQITQSILQMPSHTISKSSATVTRMSTPITALKRVSRNIRNNSVPKINLAYTPGVVTRRH